MRAIIIDVERKDVYEMDISGSGMSIRAAVGSTTIHAIAELDNGDTLYVDKYATDQPIELVKGAFSFQDYPKSLIFSNGVIVGSKRVYNGNASVMQVADAKSDLDEIKAKILFPNRAAYEDGYNQVYRNKPVEEVWT